ncbi:pyridoxamine 5'-phosphate oxidase family protein [Yeosuana marina]|uniref:pyridoxamine 5'-phosphate oxidase family protein n=1 Tax=Yeosuana marina TaxID=1565536 RepID=UPI0030C7E70A|tara:strand:- start:1237 stop:1692 length:456 start_codon:yes stop_codon:yes gene_type:complete
MSEKIVKEEYLKILRSNYIARLAYVANNTPYIVPITYYYNEKENIIISYSNEGHKINAMRLNNSVSIQIDEIDSLDQWKTLLLIGEFEELNGSEAKMYLHSFAKNVKMILAEKESKKPEVINSFSNKVNSGSIPIVYRIKIQDFFGRKQSK